MIMLRAYYKLGGIQHQPNVVDIDKLKMHRFIRRNIKI